MSQVLKLALEIFSHLNIKKKMKNLAVFDFDHTIVNENSDTAVTKLVDRSKITPDIRKLHKAEGWTAFMQQIFQVLFENKVPEPEISQLIKNIPVVEGIDLLINELHDNYNYDVIIISDSNTYFINIWLEANNLTSKIFQVFSNPAEFDEKGLLNIKMFHIQNSCKLSTRNMCKGMILEDFIKNQSEKGVNYERVVYVGDGNNDFCPILRLNETGIACVRDKFKCVDLIKKAEEGNMEEDGIKYHVKAKVCIWDNGMQILDFIKSLN